MNFDPSFSKTSIINAAAIYWDARARSLLVEIDEVDDQIEKTKSGFEQQIDQLESVIKDLKKQKKQRVALLECRAKDILS